jgi:hypothetical protein
VEIALCVYKSVYESHSGCRNHSCACINHSRKCCNYICACQNHTACGIYTQGVEISLCMWKSHSLWRTLRHRSPSHRSAPELTVHINLNANFCYIFFEINSLKIYAFIMEFHLHRFDCKKKIINNSHFLLWIIFFAVIVDVCNYNLLRIL